MKELLLPIFSTSYLFHFKKEQFNAEMQHIGK